VGPVRDQQLSLCPGGRLRGASRLAPESANSLQIPPIRPASGRARAYSNYANDHANNGTQPARDPNTRREAGARMGCERLYLLAVGLLARAPDSRPGFGLEAAARPERRAGAQ
jgi:hypothetical protein